MPYVPALGALMCVLAAISFGAMGVFGKLAFEEGSTVGTLLSVRFLVAAALLWAVLACTGRLESVRRLTRRDLGLGLLLGAIGYGISAGAFFVALDRMDASILALVVYTYPTIVAVAGIVLGREVASRRTGLALGLTFGGLVLILAGAASGSLDGLGTILGVISGSAYGVYILCSTGIASRVDPMVLATLVCTGAAITLTAASGAAGELRPQDLSLAGAGWLAAIAVLSTVGAIALFFAALRRIGPTAAAILQTFEPVATVTLAAAAFGESLGPAQLIGGAVVLFAVLIVRTPTPTDGDRPPALGVEALRLRDEPV